ncbi:Ring finger domain [Carpediemonas membranifera]|uniref:Ring finger domain n=1 Tax=Carpediemonas membranifera TaxID=201153 RepID=A0A8J6BD62_9EUKA|nr:Ring finger domain [Carpediemonas membranifera]|eukprot:KAG9395007.1 Ring finger domain [Carpediemonas membranifera]
MANLFLRARQLITDYIPQITIPMSNPPTNMNPVDDDVTDSLLSPENMTKDKITEQLHRCDGGESPLSPSSAPFCTVCQCCISTAEGIETLPCGHTFHPQCLSHWMHMGYNRCPNCNGQVSPKTVGRTWAIRNSAMSTTPSPSSRSRGLRQTGWSNVALNIIPPKGAALTITRVRYYFHPAFSSAVVSLDTQPFAVVLRLCSNSVAVIARIEYVEADGGAHEFNIMHSIEKTNCTRLYFEGRDGMKLEYNGHTEPIKHPETFFQDLLERYNRPQNYYSNEGNERPKSASHLGIAASIRSLMSRNN